MPKKYGVKEKDLVVAHVVNLILTGKLRSGDRVDRNEIAHELGVSRVPIPRGRRATRARRHPCRPSITAERTSNFSTNGRPRTPRDLRDAQRHRVGARRGSPDPEHLRQLDSLPDSMRTNLDSRAFQEAAWQFRVLINEEYAGPRLLAVIRHRSRSCRGRSGSPTSTITRTCCRSTRPSSTHPARRRRRRAHRLRGAGRDHGADHARRVGPSRRVQPPAPRQMRSD